MILDGTGRDAGETAPDDAQPEEARSAAGPAPSDFDPRFDAEFQRGYQPAPGERTRTRVRSKSDVDAPFRRPTPGDPAPTATRIPDTPRDGRPSDYRRPPADQRAAPDPVGADYGAEAGEGAYVEADPRAYADGLDSPAAAAAAAAAAGPTIVRASFLDGLDVSPRRNPYFLALWLIGGGFVVLGVVLYVVSVFTSYTSSPTSSQDVTTLVFSQVGWMLAGPLIEVGLATIVTLVILAALTARRAAAQQADDDLSEG